MNSVVEMQIVLKESATAEQTQRQIESLETVDDCWLIVTEEEAQAAVQQEVEEMASW